VELSEEKTRITHLDDGFDFLGFNVRKYAGKLLIKPSKGAIKSFLERIREIIKANVATKTEDLIRQINSKLRGWANYFRHVVAKKTFSYVDNQVFRALITWINRRHPNKSARWKHQRYFRSEGRRNWVFFASVRGMRRERPLVLIYFKPRVFPSSGTSRFKHKQLLTIRPSRTTLLVVHNLAE